MKPKGAKLFNDYIPVHWYSAEEWKRVFMLIFGPGSKDEHKKEALEILLVWKSRNPYLPSAIESTLGLVEVDLQCPTDVNQIRTSDRLLRLMYSSVIMRFVNHTLDDAQSKRFTMLQAAQNLDIPQWIVDLRHEAAHGHELPSLIMMRNATHKALEWLFNAYWEPQYHKLTNYETTSLFDNLDDNISKLLNIHNLLLMCSYPPFKLDKISKIPDAELRNDLIDDLKSMKLNFNKDIPIKNIIMKLINIFVTFVNDIKSVLNHDDMIAKIMVEPDSLFLSDIVNKKTKSNTVLPENWFILWQPLLSTMHKHNLLPALVNQLINLLSIDQETKSRKEKAAHWLRQIFFGLNKCNCAKTLDMNIDYKENVFRQDAHEKLLFLLIKKHPDLDRGLVFDLLKPVPQNISNIYFIETVLKQYNPLSIIYANELLTLCQPKIDTENVQKLLTLLKIINNNDSDSSTPDAIRTLEDLKNNCNDMIIDDTSENLCVTSDISNWRKYSGNCNFDACPIGMLPWQVGVDNPLTYD